MPLFVSSAVTPAVQFADIFVGIKLKSVVYPESARPINGNKQYKKNGMQTATLIVCILRL